MILALPPRRTCLVQGLNTQRNRSSLSNLPSKEINTIAHALHALSIYDERFFKPADEEKPATEKPSAEKTAVKPRAASSAAQHLSQYGLATGNFSVCLANSNITHSALASLRAWQSEISLARRA